MKPVERIRKFSAAIDALSLRERLAVFGAAVFVIGGLWEAFVGAPLAAREADAQQKIAAIEERLAQINESVQLTVQGMDGGMGDRVERLQLLRRRVAEAESSMRVFTSDLVDPAQMRFVIEDLLRRHAGLTLVRATNLDARPVVEADEPSPTGGAAVETEVYRHGVVLELEGSYVESLRYLEEIERLPWRLFWSGLKLEIDDYPKLRIRLEVQTLSLDEEWIGV